jgi:hypothetical protein
LNQSAFSRDTASQRRFTALTHTNSLTRKYENTKRSSSSGNHENGEACVSVRLSALVRVLVEEAPVRALVAAGRGAGVSPMAVEGVALIGLYNFGGFCHVTTPLAHESSVREDSRADTHTKTESVHLSTLLSDSTAMLLVCFC